MSQASALQQQIIGTARAMRRAEEQGNMVLFFRLWAVLKSKLAQLEEVTHGRATEPTAAL